MGAGFMAPTRLVITPGGVVLATSAHKESAGAASAWNQPIHRIRGRIKKIFGTWKRSYGLRRMRWRGLAKATAQVHFTAIAYNLKRTLNILATAA